MSIVLAVVMLAFLLAVCFWPSGDAQEAKARRLLDQVRSPGVLAQWLEVLGVREAPETGDPDAVVRGLAAMGPAAVPVCIAALTDDDWRVRYFAAEAIGRMKPAPREAAPALIQALNDRDTRVRYNAVEALGNIPSEADKISPALVRSLDEEDSSFRNRVYEAFERLGAPAAPHLIAALKDQQWRVREGAALALARVTPRGPQAGPALIRALEDEQAEVRAAAAWVLPGMDAPAKDAVPALIAALQDGDSLVRWSVVCALGEICPTDEEVISAFLRGVKDEDVKVRRAAAFALSRAGGAGTEAVPDLIELLKDDGHDGYGQGPASWSAARALEAIGPAAQAATPALAELLDNENRNVNSRCAAADALGSIWMGRPDVARHLVGRLEDQDDYVRMATARALVQMGQTDEVLPVVRELLNSEEGISVRFSAAVVLAELGHADEAVVPVLVEVLKVESERWSWKAERIKAARILGNLGRAARPAVPALTAALKDANEELRTAAAEALKKIRQEDEHPTTAATRPGEVQ